MSFNCDSVVILTLLRRIYTILLRVVLPTYRKYKPWSYPLPEFWGPQLHIEGEWIQTLLNPEDGSSMSL